MEFTVAGLTEFFNKFKNKVFVVRFDNDDLWCVKPDETDSYVLETIGGMDFIARKTFIDSKGAISKMDIPIWNYKPLFTIQGFWVLENPDDFDRLDRGALFWS